MDIFLTVACGIFNTIIVCFRHFQVEKDRSQISDEAREN